MLKISALLFKLLKENKHSGAKANPDGMVSYPDLIRFHIVSARNTLFLPTPPSHFTETILLHQRCRNSQNGFFPSVEKVLDNFGSRRTLPCLPQESLEFRFDFFIFSWILFLL